MTQTNSILLSLLLCTLITAPVLSSEEVKLVVELTRHGSRTPVVINSKEDWTKGMEKGDMTPLGHRQHFLLGREMAKQYPTIFTGRKLMGDEYYVRSSHFQRTYTSAVSHLMGLWNHFESYELEFPNGDDRIESPAVTYNTRDKDFRTPLENGLIVSPIHTETQDEDDMLFLIGSKQCPYGVNNSSKIRKDFAASVSELDSLVTLTNSVAETYGITKPASLSNMFDFCSDIADFASQDVLNNPYPKISPTDERYKKLMRCYEVNVMAKYQDKKVRQAVISNLMDNILTKMDVKAKSEETNNLKYLLFSAHDSILSPILIEAGALDLNCFINDIKKGTASDCKNFPNVASNIVFELIYFEEEYYARMRFNFENIDFCGLKNEAQGFRCPFKTFKQKWDSLLDKDWRTYCGTPPPPQPTPYPDQKKEDTNTSKAAVNSNHKTLAILLISVNILALIFGVVAWIAYATTMSKRKRSIKSNYMSGIQS